MEIKIVDGKFYIEVKGQPREIVVFCAPDGTVQWNLKGD